MSWSERRPDRRGLCLALVSFAAIGGCGFRPLYGAGSGASELFGSVAIDARTDEQGFRMRDALVRRLRPARDNAPLVLRVESRRVSRPVLVEDDDIITRYNLRVATRYTLTRRGDGRVLSEGEDLTIVAYNATPSQYATLVAERQLLDRAAVEAADKIANRLSVAFRADWLE